MFRHNSVIQLEDSTVLLVDALGRLMGVLSTTNLLEHDGDFLECARRAIRKHMESAEEGAPFHELSSRELEVARMLASGETTKQIAAQLNLSPKTIEFHRSRILGKLQLDNVVQLAVSYMLGPGSRT